MKRIIIRNIYEHKYIYIYKIKIVGLIKKFLLCLLIKYYSFINLFYRNLRESEMTEIPEILNKLQKLKYMYVF